MLNIYLMVEFKSVVPKLFPSEGQNRNVKQTATASYLNRVQNGARILFSHSVDKCNSFLNVFNYNSYILPLQ